jgi:hypothetical protein
MATRTPTRKSRTTEKTDAQVIEEIAQEADTTATTGDNEELRTEWDAQAWPDLDTMLAQKRELDARIKAERAKLPQMSKLERVIERQTADTGKWLVIHLRNRVAARVKAGQDLTEAVDAVLAQYRALLLP